MMKFELPGPGFLETSSPSSVQIGSITEENESAGCTNRIERPIMLFHQYIGKDMS